MGSVVSLIGDGRSRRRLIPTLFIYPNHKQSDAFRVYSMYAFGLPDGRVKVGIARNPRSRLVAHARTHNDMSWCHVLFLSDRRMAERAERAALTARMTSLDGTGAIASPAGSDGVGGLFSDGVRHGGRTVHPPIRGGILNPAVGMPTAWWETQCSDAENALLRKLVQGRVA